MGIEFPGRGEIARELVGQDPTQQEGIGRTLVMLDGTANKGRRDADAIGTIFEAIQQAGYRAGDEIAIASDPAASEFYNNGDFYNRCAV